MIRYHPAYLSDYALADKFRRAFVHQDEILANECFEKEEVFGLHLGMNKSQYITHELKEFKEKCIKFGLSDSGPLVVWRIDERTLYFYFGNGVDAALFESVWSIGENGLLLGNQSEFRWEPKIQYIKYGNEAACIKRVCNVKSLYKNIELQSGRFDGRETPDAFFKEERLEPIMGGNYLTFGFTEEQSIESYWGQAIVRLKSGERVKQPIWMRGADHPMFQLDMWPSISWQEGRIEASERLRTLVILSVVCENDEIRRWKYPEERVWQLNEKIKEVCITDGLSNDWIVRA